MAPAKVNLGLHVLRRRADGYHDVETVLLRLGWADVISAAASPKFSFSCSDSSLPTDSANLVVRAAEVLASRTGADVNLALHLEKRIPHGAGLGGGSSDAAAALLHITEVLDLDVSDTELSELGATLGSDVPFFLQDGAALATGRGEILSPLKADDGDPYRLPFEIVVAVPPVSVSTAAAYEEVMPNDRNRPSLAPLVLANDLAEWRAHLVNDFEEMTLAKEPRIALAKQSLLDMGAGYAALSGSGAAVFGVFEKRADADRAASALSQQNCTVWIEPASPKPKR